MKLISLFVPLFFCFHTSLGQLPENPERAFRGLFEDIQTHKDAQGRTVFEDQKTFVDSSPKRAPEDILDTYQRLKSEPGFKLREFVETNFILPPDPDDVRTHIKRMWRVLRRGPDKPEEAGSLLALPFPYIVPGGRFREMYYWDSYFTMLGLEESGEIEMIENMVQNFNYLIQHFGFIPNGNRSYYLSRSQPPYFSVMIELLARVKGDQVYATFLPALEKEYDYWMDKTAATQHKVTMPDGSELNRYYDQWDIPRAESYIDDVEASKGAAKPKEMLRALRSTAESGWDFSSRWFEDGQNNKKSRSNLQTLDLVPVDLNCLLYHLEMSLAKAYKARDNAPKHTELAQLAAKRKDAINQFCWSAEKKWYVDYNTRTGRPGSELTLAGVVPLFFQLAPKDRVPDVSRRLRAEFLKPGGVVTTLKEIPPGAKGEQWDFPNGWAPLQWLTIKGLESYGEHDLAHEIATRWRDLNIKVFKETGRLMEKYDVVHPDAKAGGGEYKSQEGFGWTNGVLLKLISMYGMPSS